MSESFDRHRVAVIGGGIAGLSAAFHLRELMRTAGTPGETIVFERAAQSGGTTRTERIDGYTLDRGPNGWLSNEPLMDRLVDELGLTGEIVRSNDAARNRFIYTRGRLHRLPDSPPRFLTSGLLTLRQKLRVLGEVMVRGRRDDEDESVYDFGRRRLGKAFAETMLDPMVSGIFAGDVRRLSLPAAFPAMRQMELEYGGLFRAMIAKRRAARRTSVGDRTELAGERPGASGTLAGKPPVAPGAAPKTSGGPGGPGGVLTTLSGGVGRLTEELGRQLGDCIRANCQATMVCPHDGGFEVRFDGGCEHFDAVVVAVPAYAAADLVNGFAPRAAEALAGIEFADVAVVCHSFDSAAGLNGFGHLIPRGEGIRSLGCLWTSSIFPQQSAAGHTLLRTLLGGATDGSILGRSDDELHDGALGDIRTVLGLEAAATNRWIFRHERGIAQYTMGHRGRVAVVDHLCAELPGIAFVGASYRGVSLNRCVRDAYTVAPTVLRKLGVPFEAPDGAALKTHSSDASTHETPATRTTMNQKPLEPVR
ncbi:MAG: protoporphyrinogen oxidase [Planctomycetes bacterium]|nr:protoporphyrinogen oxidase [Planctomycetota bacterium]